MSNCNQDSGFNHPSRFNFITIMLGMTVCFSTLWRFPYQVASFGGLAYIVIYLAMLIFFVYPALTAEWGLGRLTSSGPEQAYESLKMPKIISYMLFFIVFAIGSYFIVWIGWLLVFGYKGITDSSLVNPRTSSSLYFTVNIVNQPVVQFMFAGIVLVLLSFTVLGGTHMIERASRIIVPIFFTLIGLSSIILLLQPGVLTSIIEFFSTTDIQNQITPFTFIAALGQAFFSLCLGGTYMVLYSSYMKATDKHEIPINAGLTIFGNTVASFLSIFLVFGIILYSNSGLSSFASFGPSLFFAVIPQAFQSLILPTAIIQISLVLFFLMFFLSAYMPMVAILEVLIMFVVKKYHTTRKNAFIIISLGLLLASIPSILSPLEGGFLYNLDIFVGALGSGLGSVIALYAFGWKNSKKDVLNTINSNSRLKMGNTYYFILKYFTPFCMIFVILYALSDVIVGYFPLNSIPSSNYILYPLIIEFIPTLVVVIGMLVALTIYFHRNELLNSSD